MITVVLRRCRRPLLGLYPEDGIFDMETLRVALTGMYPLGNENCVTVGLREALGGVHSAVPAYSEGVGNISKETRL